MPATDATLAAAGEIFAALQGEAAAEMPGTALRFRQLIEMRYAGQEHTVPVAIAPDGLTLAAPLEAFHAAHERAFTFRLAHTAAELVTFHLEAEQLAPRVDLPLLDPAGRSLAAARRGSRDLLLDGGSARQPAIVFDRDLLPIEVAVVGPLLVEESSTTTMVLPGQSARIDPHGLLIIEAD